MALGIVPIEISDWHTAPLHTEGEAVFAIGDAHGCASELEALLAAVAATTPGARRRLVFLGDLIDRGPDSLGTLMLWARDAVQLGVDAVDRLMGNHEQLVLLAISGSPHATKAEAMWLSKAIGGESFLAEMRSRAGEPEAPLSAGLVERVLGAETFALFRSMRSHLTLGNLLFVHGGIDPTMRAETLLARPWTEFTEARWAWIQQEFLEWRGGFGGHIVIHGHTPPAKHFAFTGEADPHLLSFDRLGLDGGSALTGIVTGAQIEDGRYRIFRAGSARERV